MTTKIDNLREALNRSPGWQKIREYTKEGKWEMEQTFKVGDKVCVNAYTHYQYLSKGAHIEPPREHPIDAHDAMITDIWYDEDNETNVIVTDRGDVIPEVECELIPRKPGRPVELNDAQPTSFKLDAPSREAIATIRAARPELADNSAVIREALRIYAGQMEAVGAEDREDDTSTIAKLRYRKLEDE